AFQRQIAQVATLRCGFYRRTSRARRLRSGCSVCDDFVGELMGRKRFFSFARLGICLAVVALATTLGACASNSSSGSSTTAGKVPPTIAQSGCGSLPLHPVKDPDGVIAALPKQYQGYYKGYTVAVHKSPWINWKPTHAPPYHVAVAWSPLVSDFQ